MELSTMVSRHSRVKSSMTQSTRETSAIHQGVEGEVHRLDPACAPHSRASLPAAMTAAQTRCIS